MKKYKVLSFLVVASITLSLGACDATKNQLMTDREGDMDAQDYKDALAPRLPEVDENKKANDYASIPQLEPYVGGVNGIQSSMPLVSISVNQTVPLRDVLYELAQQAEYDIELDPRITGAIIFSAREKPLDEVIGRISDMAGLRYNFENETVRVELDTPTNQVYKLDFLNLIKTSSSNISNDISVVSGEGADTGSGFETSFESESDFWAELETNIQQILAASNSRILKTNGDPEITAAPQQPTVVPVAAPDASGNVQVSPPDVNLNIGSLPTGGGESYENAASTYAINKQAGIIQIFAPQRTQEKISSYLKLVRRSTTSQVLIEAKILEVELNDQYAAGIEWGTTLLSSELITGLSRAGTDGSTGQGTPLFNTNGSVDSVAGLSGTLGSSVPYFGFLGNDLTVAANALSTFGTVKALASPRVTVLNGQPAALNVATNRVYFEIEEDLATGDNSDPSTSRTATIKSVPEGVLLNVLPSIDLDRGTISMSLRPTITRITNNVPNPIVSSANVPEVNVQEIDSVMNMRSGQAIVMGGLLSDRTESRNEGVPVLSDVPLLGNLFKQKADSVSKTEIVILIKATIIDSESDTIHDTDKDLYRKFSSDRRPFKL
ncbi:secretin N-terminal domain-containing protein [Alphaproteobacteria bacterium]|nr:secretin N-terminal domain-containing protein [Alphaproteobacteria bacterium]